jgi:hypothetical protein
VKRWPIIIVALLVGAAAPARAWCEAICSAPVHASQPSHCPSEEQTPTDGPALSNAGSAECPAIETARPAPAKLELGINPTAAHPDRFLPTHSLHALHLLHPLHLRGLGRFDADVPLRI